MSMNQMTIALGQLRAKTRTQKQSLPTRIAGAIAILSAITAVTALLGFWLFGLRFNTTASMPFGIYRITRDPKASLIAFCLLGNASKESLEREYRTAGSCPDHGEPLLKNIIASPGDQVDMTENGIQVNNVLLTNTKPRLNDRAGRLLKPWPAGHYIVPPGYVWVASTFNPFSYDSRYYGPISTNQIRYRLHAFFTFGSH